ncbi:class I-like SAM-binding methyltransferase superfamily [Bonamia ostreae]|uniref:Class I-like SAM-binding methyltransferase superfamily n=1 Tax=Bonamia ostreae TaxID=126728 RepID=A0ABV2ATF4_9EUKA
MISEWLRHFFSCFKRNSDKDYFSVASSYLGFFKKADDNDDTNRDLRSEKRTSITNSYYDLVTDFYELGWGKSFHFAPRHNEETLRESITRHEFYLCYKLGIDKNEHVLDAGCGVMGPARLN